MPKKSIQAQETDLDRTDRLPVLDLGSYEADANDDGLVVEHSSDTAVLAVISPDSALHPDFARAGGLDLPSLAETVRSVEARIARQTAEHEILMRDHERLKEAESAAVARAEALTADLAALRTSFEAEQARARELDITLAERSTAADFAKARAEEAQRDAQRLQDESLALRTSLATRDESIVQMLQSLNERDAQLLALQREHAQLVPVLEARSKTTTQLEAELQAARTQAQGFSEELQASKSAMAALSAQMARSEAQLEGVRAELAAVKAQSATYFEQLQTRDWRQEFSQNLLRETDSELGTVQSDLGNAARERDQLQGRVAELSAQVQSQAEAIENLQGTIRANDQSLRAYAEEKERSERAHAEALESGARERAAEQAETQRSHAAQIARSTSEFTEAKAALERTHAEQIERMTRERAMAEEQTERLHAAEQERAARELAEQRESSARALAELTEQFAALKAEHGRVSGLLVAADEELARLRTAAAGDADLKSQNAAEITRLQSGTEAARREIETLTAQLQEARGPTDAIEAEVRRLTEELAAKSAKFDALEEENRHLKDTLQRARGALEEREFLIRRLERSESTNANVLGRIQTSIERLGTAPAGSSTLAAPPPSLLVPQPQGELSVELTRIDGGNAPTSYPLGRRTRIGRAIGCELLIESTSVSRHHALVLVGPREAVIEDLNSTNGVFVNGRKIARHLLADGDLVIIGDAQFRVSAKHAAA